MIYRHIRTGKQYRFLFPTFDATNQKPWAVYVCLESGVLFSRDGDDFAEKFEFVETSQDKVMPRPSEKRDTEK